MLSKVFNPYDVRGVYPDPLNEQVAWRVGLASGRYLKAQLAGRDASDPMLQHVVVGRDVRPHSAKLTAALIEGVRCSGMNVFDVGAVDTPLIYFAINHLGCGGGIQTTASHNPVQYNGFKVSGRGGAPIGSTTGLVDIQRIAATLEEAMEKPTGRVERRDLREDYADHIRKFARMKRPLKVVVDIANGMAGTFIPEVFAKLDLLEVVALNGEMSGRFAHDPNPLVPQNMKPVCNAVAEHGADFGVSFDGDADRCILCDERGVVIGGDLLGALFAEHALAKAAGAAVIYDVRSSKALAETVARCGGKPIRARAGHVFLRQAMREHNAVFGSEITGHQYFRDNFHSDSGAITLATALSIVSQSGRAISRLIEPYRAYHQSGEVNFRVNEKDAAIIELRRLLTGRAAFDELDGLTADAWDSEGWWLNVRKSNTEPLLRLNLEARERAMLDGVLGQLKPLLGEIAAGQ